MLPVESKGSVQCSVFRLTRSRRRGEAQGILACGCGDSDRALRHLEDSLRLAEEINSDDARVAALNNLALALRARGELSRAETLTRSALAICVQQDDRHREAALLNNLADLLRAQGQEHGAMATLKRAVALFAEISVDQGDLEPEIWKLVDW